MKEAITNELSIVEQLSLFNTIYHDITNKLKTRMTRQPGNAIPLCNVNELVKQIPRPAFFVTIISIDSLSISMSINALI